MLNPQRETDMNVAIATIVAVAWLALALLLVFRGGRILGKRHPKPPGIYVHPECLRKAEERRRGDAV